MAVMRNVLEGPRSKPHFPQEISGKFWVALRILLASSSGAVPVAQASACVVLIFARVEKRTD